MLLVKTFIAPSPIHGIGLFAGEDIPAGTVWWRFLYKFDQVLSAENVASLPELARQFWQTYAFRNLQGYMVLCGDHGRFVNHSDTPNSKEGPNGVSIAAVLIRNGEEITDNYGSW